MHFLSGANNIIYWTLILLGIHLLSIIRTVFAKKCSSQKSLVFKRHENI